MRSKTGRWTVATYLISLCLCLSACVHDAEPSIAVHSPAATAAAPSDAVSRFGEYRGYSEQLYSEWLTTSQYVTTRDGTRIAVDISRPAVDGKPVETPYPVVWTFSRYHRRWTDKPMIDGDPVLQRLLKHGYVIASAAVRGSGASFGRYEGLFSHAETNDAYDLIDWFAQQPWCSGNVGMFGLSYLGITQYMAASRQHPALKAIMPDVAFFDFYDFVYSGGIYRQDMVRHWSENVRALDTVSKAVPVDTDPDGQLLDAAIREHLDNFDPIAELRKAPFRDSRSAAFGWNRDTPAAVLPDLNASGVAAYQWGGWYDAFAMDTLLLFENFTGPHKLAIGPWAHEPITPAEKRDKERLLSAESHRWFDYWLKGVQNGVMDGPRIHFAVIDVPQTTWSWSSADDLGQGVEPMTLYLGQTTQADGDYGLLTAPAKSATALEYAVDMQTTTGSASRWDTTVGGPEMHYPDMSPNDRRSLTFTTAPLAADVVVVGTPVVRLHAASSATDSDFYLLLEEVDADGTSRYVSEGMLRASFRRLGTAPWNQLGVPWHPGRAADSMPLTPGKAETLDFYIIPTALRFSKGNRIRIAIMGADKDNTEAPPAPDAVLTIIAGGENASKVVFPVLKASSAD